MHDWRQYLCKRIISQPYKLLSVKNIGSLRPCSYVLFHQKKKVTEMQHNVPHVLSNHITLSMFWTEPSSQKATPKKCALINYYICAFLLYLSQIFELLFILIFLFSLPLFSHTLLRVDSLFHIKKLLFTH